MNVKDLETAVKELEAFAVRHLNQGNLNECSRIMYLAEQIQHHLIKPRIAQGHERNVSHAYGNGDRADRALSA